MKKIQYAYWDLPEVGEPEEDGHWMMFDTLDDAVNSGGEREIFVLTAKRLGMYKSVAKVIKTKKTKKELKNAG